MAKKVVVGIGGVGCRIVERIGNATTIAIDTDKRILIETKADMKVLIGATLNKDRKAGKFDVLEDLLDADTVIVCLGPSRLEVLAQTCRRDCEKAGSSKIPKGVRKLADAVIAFEHIDLAVNYLTASDEVFL